MTNAILFRSFIRLNVPLSMLKNHAKISYGINQAKKMLGEVEYLLNICERLKTEADIPTNNLWARTQPDMKEIHNRLKEIANRINRMGK